ncbi:hypothetical protein EDF39_1129 [Frondihabitans sp. PhB161]|nr:hypothetical protein EDF37_1127 [Frondihabitans sp. PhB153]RPF08731.1 hypothetical protein EDF39_1129 [Frondihabitans sp. PhB161]
MSRENDPPRCYWRSHPWWRLSGAGLGLALFVVAGVMFLLHAHGAHKVFDVGAILVSAASIAWLLFRDRYEVSGEDTGEAKASIADDR